MLARYDIREEHEGWTVYDVWTGWPAVVHATEQTGLPLQVAEALADALTILAEKRQPLP